MGSVCCFLLLATLSCSVDIFSCELWYLRCSVVGSHSIAMYELLLLPNSCSLHFITQPWQNLLRKLWSAQQQHRNDFVELSLTQQLWMAIKIPNTAFLAVVAYLDVFPLQNMCWHRRPVPGTWVRLKVLRIWWTSTGSKKGKYSITLYSKLNKNLRHTTKSVHNVVLQVAFLPYTKCFSWEWFRTFYVKSKKNFFKNRW